MTRRTGKQKVGDVGEAMAWMEPGNLARARRYYPNHPGADLYRIDKDGVLHESEVKSTRKTIPVNPPLSRTQANRQKEIEARDGTYKKIIKHVPGANLGIRENLRDISDTLLHNRHTRKGGV